jgi:hypothetical protein
MYSMHSKTWQKVEVSGQLHTWATLPRQKKPLVSLKRRMSRPLIQSGCGDKQRNPCPYKETVIEPI